MNTHTQTRFFVHNTNTQAGGGVNATASRWDIPQVVTGNALHHLTLQTHSHADANSSVAELCFWTRHEQPPHHHRVRPEATAAYVGQRGQNAPRWHDLKCLCLCGGGVCNINVCMSALKEVQPKRQTTNVCS